MVFYPIELEYDSIPSDAVEVSDEDYIEIANRTKDQQIAVDGDGYPYLEPVIFSAVTEEQAYQMMGSRLQAAEWSQALYIPAAIKDKWALYITELHGVPAQSGFPANIIWPVAP